VVAWGMGRSHMEISGSATGLTSRPSAEMCFLSQVGLSVCHELPRTSDSADVRSLSLLGSAAVGRLPGLAERVHPARRDRSISLRADDQRPY
jgi:hypothetical protein